MWVLRPKGSLEIECRRSNITQHQHSSPFGYSNTCSKLAYRQSNCPAIFFNCFSYPIETFFCAFCVVCFRLYALINIGQNLAITSCKNYFIFTKYRVFSQHFFKSFCRINTRKKPKCMIQFLPVFCFRKRKST